MSEGRRFCENCGTEVSETTNFCPNCGITQRLVENHALPTDEPLLELRTHWFMTSLPVRITIYESGIEFVRSDLLRSEDQRMSYGQVAQVAVRRRLVFSTLVIESRGGATIVAEGLPQGEVDQAARLIEERMSG